MEGDQGRQLIEMLRGLINRVVMMQTADPSARVDLGEIQKTARSLRDLSQAMRLEQDFAAKIREEARREAEKKMEDAVDAVTGAPGGAALTPAEMRERLLAAYRGDA